MKERLIRIAIRLGLVGLGLLLALVAIHGCTLAPNNPTLMVTVSPDKGHPPFNIAIAAACSESGGTFTFTPPDGEPVESNTGSFKATVNDYPYNGTINWTDGERTVSRSITVGLVNKKPIAHNLSITPHGSAQYSGKEMETVRYLEKEIIDLGYHKTGCPNGDPSQSLQYYGIEDPDYTQNGYSAKNDHFQYRVEIHDEDTGKQETVFDSTGDPLPAGEFRSDPRFTWFPGWTKTYPPFPLQSMSAGLEEDPPGTKIIHIIVREWGAGYSWEYKVVMSERH